MSCPTFTMLTPWRNSFWAHTRSSFSSWLYSTSRALGLEVCGGWMGGVEGVQGWVVVHVCMVGRWRVEGGTHSLPATPTSTISCYVYIKPYPHAITLNSYHSNQPYIPIVELVTRTIWILLSTVCRTQTEANNLWCESHDFICLETWTDDNLKHCLL